MGGRRRRRGGPNSIYSTSHTPRAHSKYQYPLPPDHLPDSVQPPPQKSHAPTKTKSPCIPNDHPRNATETLKIPRHAKLEVTLTPLNQWHPPNPPALTAPTDGLLISFELQSPLYLQPSRPRQRDQRRNLFHSPPSPALPPPASSFISANHRVHPSRTNEAPTPSVPHSTSQPFPYPLLSCGTSASTGGMKPNVLDIAIAGSGYLNPASGPLKSCGTWTKCLQHSSAPSPPAIGVCLVVARGQPDNAP